MNVLLALGIAVAVLLVMLELASRIVYYGSEYDVGQRIRLVLMGRWLIDDAKSPPLHINEMRKALGIGKDTALAILSSSANKNVEFVRSVFLGKTGRVERYNYVPPIGFLPAPGQDLGHLKINSLGFRGDDVEFDKAKGTRRVVLLGGSVAYGRMATSNENSIARQLEKKLNDYSRERHGWTWEVINLAAPAVMSYQELLILMKFGLKYGPDIVISLSGFNDVFHYLESRSVNEPVAFHKVKRAYNVLVEHQNGISMLFYVLQKYFVSLHFLEALVRSAREESENKVQMTPYKYPIW